MEYVPVPSSATVVRLKLLELEFWVVTVLPFGSFNVSVTFPMLLLVACTVSKCEAVALKESVPICPGLAIVTATALPSTLIDPLTSGETS